ncbi:flagellar protein FlgN [Caldimonas brevitalea]|uniref:Flagella synthesis protein FlgN n=1 Tax=Caldimonas brevitalea TaxID=413882 RepID=A0A0G3BSK0_9BURK|nr:flagellar protein FlgN [Caldimonas brevitalea]AKJ30356.1 flagella synthesis protein FlgN [Caldimonas brevitalea]
MKAPPALARLLLGVRADLADYARLRELLQEQFDVALRHDSQQMAETAERISALTAALEARRGERVALAAELLGKDAPVSMQRLVPLVPAPARAALQDWWQTLEALVRECKALNARNCRLMMDQHEIMQRVLHSEVHTYAPT